MDRRQRVTAAMSPSGRTGVRIISVLSGKGGVGKSVIAFNLAERLAAGGVRVLLVDADFNCGNIHLLANTSSDYGVEEFGGGKLSLAEAVISYSSDLDILPSVRTGDVSSLHNVTAAARLAANLRQQASNYDLIVFDHSSGVSNPATVLASASDINIIVLIPELTSISDGYGLCKYLHKSNPSVECRLLLNRVNSNEEAQYVRTKLGAIMDRFLNWQPRFAGFFPEDKAVLRSIAAQCPIARLDGESSVFQQLNYLAAALISELVGVKPALGLQTVNNDAAIADIRG